MHPSRVVTAASRGLCALALAPACIAPATAFAQAQAPVVVTASRIAQPQEAVLADLQVIEREAIDRAAGLSLPELLQLEAGVEIAGTGGPGQPAGLFLRGSSANHVVLLVDGVRLQSATTGTNAFEHLPLAQIERIEVLRAPASSLYGADAIGGVIQVFTRQGARDEARLLLGSQRSRELSAGLGRRSDAGTTRWSLQAGARSVDAFSATNERAAFVHDPDRDPYRNRHLSAGVEHDWAPGHTLALRALASRATTHFDGGPGSDDLNRQRIGTLTLESRDRLGERWRSLLRVARGSDELATEGAFPGRFRTDQDQALWQNELALGFGSAVLGAEWRRERVGSDTAYTATARRIASLFASAVARSGAHSLQASLRHDDNSQFGGRGTGTLAYGFAVSPALRLHASVGTAFKAPSFNDLYYPLQFGFSGNPGLRPERSRSAEAGLRWREGAWSAGVVLFDNRIRDLISVDPSFTTVVNVNRAHIRGATLDGAWAAGPWRLRAQWTHQRPRDEDAGTQLVRRARDHGSAGLGYAAGAWTLGADLVAAGARFDGASNDPATRMGGYALMHLHAAYALTPQWRATARLDNATDRAYELAQGYNTAGRQLFVGLEYRAQR